MTLNSPSCFNCKHRRQDDQGDLITYQVEQLDLDTKQALLKPIPPTPLFTRPIHNRTIDLERPLTEATSIPLNFNKESTGAQLNLELHWGTLKQQITGYELCSRTYSPTCLNSKCLNFKNPLPNSSSCPKCGQPVRKAELAQTLDSIYFTKPLETQFSCPLLQISLNQPARKAIEHHARSLKAISNTNILTTLKDFSPTYLALHSAAHQLLKAIPLVIRADAKDANFILSQQGNNCIGIFYDCAHGDNGASEGILKNFHTLCTKARSIAQQCNCQSGCVRCIIQPGCPDLNAGLNPHLGLFLINALE